MSKLISEEWFLNNGFTQEGEDNDNHSPYFYKEYMDSKFLFRFAKFRKNWGFYIELLTLDFKNKGYV
jgi:hypothetical protein